MMNYYVTMDSFGSECPANWEAIAAALNTIIDDRNIADDQDACNELWEEYWSGKLPEVPAAEEA